MKKVIITKYLCCTNTLPARMSAKAPDNKARIFPIDDDRSDEGIHETVCRLYKEWLNWEGTLIPGWLGNRKGVVHVFIPDDMCLVSKKFAGAKR